MLNQSQSEAEPNIVAIGSSAGGPMALKTMMESLPQALNAVYIIMQHLPAHSKSMLPDILARNCPLPIQMIEDGMEIKPNHVYVMAAGFRLFIAENRFWLCEYNEQNRVSYPINDLFNSLAKYCGNRSVGIILSGTGSDGSRGVAAIKEVGGLVLAQSPKSSEFSGMPENAIKTGAVDRIGTIEELMDALVRFCSSQVDDKSQSEKQNKMFEDSQLYISKILELLMQTTGINFSNYKESTIRRRISHQLGLSKLTSLKDYLHLLQNNEQAVYQLKNDILIGVTQFFRDNELWSYLKDNLLKEMIATKNEGDIVRAWVAGCATGEEAYTLAILLSEVAQDREIRVFATDLDGNNIDVASSGKYPNAIEAELPPMFLEKYFYKLKDGNGYQVKETLRKKLVFATHDLLADPPFSNMDIVCCRNTLIYFQPQIQRDAMAIFNFALKIKGILILGYAESPSDFEPYFGIHDSHLRIYYKQSNRNYPTGRVHNMGQRHSRAPLPIRTVSSPTKSIRMNEPMFKVMIRTVKDAILDHFCPAALILESNLNVIYSLGDTSPYTKKPKSGKVDNNLSSIIRDSLLVAAMSAIDHLKKGGQYHRAPGLYIDEGENSILCDLEVFTVPIGESAEILTVIAFMPQSTQLSDKYNPNTETEKRIVELEAALNERYEDQRELEEELHYTREELQSVNEELMAANEELQTTNEELQSVNEELFTLNAEYQNKIDLITQSNADLDNLLNCTNFATLFLNKDMLVRRFTAKVNKYINLVAADIDRNIKDFTLRFECLEFLDDIKQCMQQGNEINHTCKLAENGEQVKIVISPYTLKNDHAESSIEGAVITFQS